MRKLRLGEFKHVSRATLVTELGFKPRSVRIFRICILRLEDISPFVIFQRELNEEVEKATASESILRKLYS